MTTRFWFLVRRLFLGKILVIGRVEQRRNLPYMVKSLNMLERNWEKIKGVPTSIGTLYSNWALAVFEYDAKRKVTPTAF